jgi:putative sterol carrier protein
MDVLELTERAVELASKDEELREKTKGTVATIVMALKNGEDTSLTISIDRGELRFSREGAPNPDFQFEISKENFYKLMTGKAHGMILMATGKLKLTKGSWGEIGKIAKPLGLIPKLGKEIAAKEEKLAASGD